MGSRGTAAHHKVPIPATAQFRDSMRGHPIPRGHAPRAFGDPLGTRSPARWEPGAVLGSRQPHVLEISGSSLRELGQGSNNTQPGSGAPFSLAKSLLSRDLEAGRTGATAPLLGRVASSEDFLLCAMVCLFLRNAGIARCRRGQESKWAPSVRDRWGNESLLCHSDCFHGSACVRGTFQNVLSVLA